MKLNTVGKANKTKRRDAFTGNGCDTAAALPYKIEAMARFVPLPLTFFTFAAIEDITAIEHLFLTLRRSLPNAVKSPLH